ncbi:MAG: SDR family oxidoreductase [Roseiarcus sp.]|jgi:nucleoside-diphosphate-sugar epimerase
MERVLVTGAGGYIGTILVPTLLEAGYAVRAIDRFFFGRELLHESENLEIVREDTRRLSPKHFAGVDYVIDLVAISNDPSGEAFEAETYAINFQSRVKTARLAKQTGAKRYVLPSSCSIYGFQEPGVIVDETSKTRPLTAYAKANELAEQGVLPLASEDFVVVVLRQATVYGYAPRMRFDLAINGMTYGAWKTGRLPLMRDGTQWRPMIHVKDAARAQIFMLTAPAKRVNGQIFNVGSEKNNYQLGPLAEQIARSVPRKVEIEWYGPVDNRSYRVGFGKINALGYEAQREAEDGVTEVCDALQAGRTDRTTKTITLDWYKELVAWQQRLREIEIDGALLAL